MCKEITPTAGRILVEPHNVEAISDGGIVLTGQLAADYLHGEVLAVGDGRIMNSGERMVVDVKVGDRIIYGDLNTTVEDTLNGKRVLLIVEAAIVARIKE